MKQLTLVLLALAASACDIPQPPPPIWSNDQCLRAQLFQQCLDRVPKGPEHVKYNDWSEVVSECEDAARQQSIRRTEIVKPECRG